MKADIRFYILVNVYVLKIKSNLFEKNCKGLKKFKIKRFFTKGIGILTVKPITIVLRENQGIMIKTNARISSIAKKRNYFQHGRKDK